jgi:riboflavin kinase/FMN adenylyltransferase
MNGVASLGTRPAIEAGGRPVLEVHLLDANLDAYGKLVRVEFLQKLRDEANYDRLDALIAQIERDADQARRYFLDRSNG